MTTVQEHPQISGAKLNTSPMFAALPDWLSLETGEPSSFVQMHGTVGFWLHAKHIGSCLPTKTLGTAYPDIGKGDIDPQ